MTVSVSTREEPLDLAYTLLSGQDFNNKLGNQKSQVTNTSSMFSSTSINSGLDLTSWNVSNWTTIGGYAFAGITADYVDLSGWDTSSLMEIGESVFSMIKAEHVDLRGWNLTNISYGEAAFYDDGTTGTVYYVSNEATKEIVETYGATAIIME